MANIWGTPLKPENFEFTISFKGDKVQKFNMHDMDLKEIKIECPEGYTSYIENSVIKFKKKESVDWNTIVKWYETVNEYNTVLEEANRELSNELYEDVIRKIMHSKLAVIAAFYNDGWKKTYDNNGYVIGFNRDGLFISQCGTFFTTAVYFRSRSHAERAINILKLNSWSKYLSI